MSVVSALVCHAHVGMAVDCLGSLLRLHQGPLSLQIHDDGSLTAEDRDELVQGLPATRIVSRAEADDRLQGFLNKQPGLRRLRESLVLGLKLIDTVLLHPQDTYRYCDADVLFVKRLSFPPGEGEHLVFMADRAPSYSFRSWQLWRCGDVRLPGKSNTGIVLAPKRLIDWDYLEWFVLQARHQGIKPMLEQTAWAALGMKVGCRMLDARQVRVMREGEPSSELVAGHFTARTRHLLPEFVQISREADLNAAPVMLRTERSGRCTSFDLACYEMRRLVSRLTRSIQRKQA